MTDIQTKTCSIVSCLVSTQEFNSQKQSLIDLTVLFNASDQFVLKRKSAAHQSELLSALNYRTVTNESNLTYKFLLYLFRTRFEWMDQNNQHKPFHSASREKAEIFDQIDLLLKIISTESVCVESLQAFKQIGQEFSRFPVVRSQLAGHVMVWFSNAGSQINAPEIYMLIQDILLSAITDVWSTVRKSTCARLNTILQHLNHANLHSLYDQLIQICLEKSSPWQSVDGAILGITVILNQYGSNNKAEPSLDFIKTNLLSTVFSLISHPQLTIRETAAKSLLVYISCLGEHEALITFQKVLFLLNSQHNCDEEVSVSGLVEAYKAEGLLNICCSMIKILPLKCLLPKLLSYLTVFLSYLSHEASTVRQTTSSVFKQLLLKADSNPVLFKLILTKLTADWLPCYTDSSSNTLSLIKRWEGKEGRLFVYELICEYLVKNHWLNTFGPLQPTKHGELRRLSTSALSESKMENCNDKIKDNNDTVWHEVISEFKDKSLLEKTRVYDEFTKQHEKCVNDLPLLFMKQCRLYTDGHESIKPLEFIWLKNIRIAYCTELLETMLHQTIECLTDGQWELARIAQQVLPVLSEVMRWYDIDINIKIIDKLIVCKNDDRFMYLGIYLLKESLEHCVRLLPLLKDPPKSWKNPERCVEIINVLIEKLKYETERYIILSEEMLNRLSYDRFTCMATEIILILHNTFDVNKDKMKILHQAIFNKWQMLYQFSHPTSQICHMLPDISKTEFKSPFTGYLSCCLVEPEGDVQCARQVEKHLVMSIYEYMSTYLSHYTQPYYLPIIAHYVGQFADDSLISKELIQCLMVLCRQVIEPILTKSIETEDKQTYLKCIFYTLKELAAVIAIKTFDVTLLQKVLSAYFVLCRPINPIKHLPTVLKAICSRLNKQRRNTVELSPRLGSSIGGTVFDIPPPSFNYQGELTALEIETDFYTERDTDVIYTECLSLNGCIGGSSKRRAVNLSFDETGGDDDDDWDSWSEEEESDTSLSDCFRSFFHQLKQTIDKDGKDVLQEEIDKLKEVDVNVLNKLLN
ncbi:hypothetical protein SNE40_007053 [Patella caerulea]|uniref:Uncharacterized protein n=1 Tax=Patella caerulea TaxID=87958 RepID=A0AAN8JXR3_PATCE